MRIKHVMIITGICLTLLSYPMQTSAQTANDAASQMESIINDLQTEAATEGNDLQNSPEESQSEEGREASAEKTKDTQDIVPLNIMFQTTDTVNLRSGPDTSYKSLGKLEAGQSVMATGQTEDGAWYQIYYEGRNAYISSEFAAEAEAHENLEEELAESSRKAQQEIEADIRAQLQEQEAQAELEKLQEQQKEAEVSQDAAESQEKPGKGINWALLIAGIFVVVFCISVVGILVTDKAKKNLSLKERDENLEIIDLEALEETKDSEIAEAVEETKDNN